MTDSHITRCFATDPRIANPKPFEMHANATIFLQDAAALGERATAGQFFLFMHAIELALKAFLHWKGRPLSGKGGLESFRHDLDKLLKEARSTGMTVSQPDSDAIVYRLNKYTWRAAIRYDFSFTLPLIGDVRRVATALIIDAAPPLPPVGSDQIA